jgi:hypothetical protein
MKGKEAQPIWDYESNIVDILENKSRYLYILKATGIGITTLILYWLIWRMTRDDEWRGRQVCVIVGPNITLAVKLVNRVRKLFAKHNLFFSTKETYLNINGCELECFPSFHVDSFRSLENPACIYISEGDFFPAHQQTQVRHVAERYIGKSDSYIVIESTPNAPGGLMETILKEEPSIYTKLKLDWTVAVNKTISERLIKQAQKSISFQREYELAFSGRLGNSFHPSWIDKATKVEYNPDFINEASARVIGIDPSWGSSATGILIMDSINSKACVLYAEEFKHAEYEDMVGLVAQLMDKYAPIDNVFVDGAQVAFIKSLKGYIDGEPTDYHAHLERIKPMITEFNPITNFMKVVPVNFRVEHQSMLSTARMAMENGYMGIRPKFTKLIARKQEPTTIKRKSAV